jgi:iron complex outermembrane receptor protein
MMIFRFLLTCFFCILFAHAASTQEADSMKSVTLQQIQISATLAGDKMPMTFTNLKREQIRRQDFGQDIPFLLQSTPSVVETSDAGTGIGYTGLRIRGSDATRTNITIDGIPLNDSESQLVYWVNMPDFVSSTNQIQIQRGVGTSTNGAGAFGATVNLQTNSPTSEKFIGYSGGIGSFGTRRHSLQLGSGWLRNGLNVEARLSRISSDGYVDRASAKLGSAFVSATYLRHKTSVKFKAFTGSERTYQSWYGIPEAYLSDETLRRSNPAGTEKEGEPYPNQTDNYGQSHAHLTLNHAFLQHWSLNATLHYTRGKGFYEEYKANRHYAEYLLGAYEIVGRDTFRKTDLVRRLWLDNHFYGGVWSVRYETGRLQNIGGGAWNRYEGAHFGTVEWTKNPSLLYRADFNSPHKFYQSTAVKTDFNLFDKLTYALSARLNGFLDLQYRQISYYTEGGDRRQRAINRHQNWHFFNPKMGLVYQYTGTSNGEGGRFYGSISVANREPNRNDMTDAELTQLPRSERLLNTEIGWRGQFKNAVLAANFYHMAYQNQLVVTGNINDVGEQIRVNVPKSYRMGLEIESSINITEGVDLSGNASFSQNKIQNFVEYRDNWATGAQDKIEHGKTDIAFSPNAIANLNLAWRVYRTARQSLFLTPSVKYVGRQFIDNTSNLATALPAFWYANFQIHYQTAYKKLKNCTVKLAINNWLDQKYVNNAWTYRFTSPGYDPRPDDPYARSEGKDVYNLTGYFPQAGQHWLLGVSFGF